VKRTLVTGAAGFTGRYIGAVLASHGHEPHGLVYGRVEPIDGYAHVHQADLTNSVDLDRVISEVRPTHVVHLAAIAYVAHGDVDQMYRVNLVGTRNLLETLNQQTAKPQSILLASSANVYGNSRAGMLDEETPLAPVNDYGVSKTAMEFVASIYRPVLPLIITRPFNYTGRGQGSQFIVPKIIDHARTGKSIIELGNLDVARDFSDVRMVADAYARVLDAEAAIGCTFNVCSGRAVLLKEVIELVEGLSGRHLEVRVNQALVRANEVKTLHGSKTRIEHAIGPLQSIALEETLLWMLNG
jgi:nucleoside-diphosphate-sugar epimerase